MSSSTITGFKLSSQQRQVWQRSSRLGHPQTIQCGLTLHGDLDVPRLQTALQTIVNRYEIFRTTFQEMPGMTLPLQVIQEQGCITWQRIDLSSDVAQAAVIAAHRDMERLKINTTGQPELRALLFQQSEQNYTLLLTLLALSADLPTCQILLTQLGQAYDGTLLSDEEPVQYAQFSTWQDQLLTEPDEDTQAAQAFWQQQDLLLHQPLSPPLGYRDVRQDKSSLQIHRVEIAPHVANALLSMESAIETILLTGWLILLWRHTEQSEFTIGVVCDARQDEELAEACGPFTHVLPLQSQFSDTTAFSALQRQIEQAWHNLSDWQDYVPLNQLNDLASLPISFEFVNQLGSVTSARITFNLDYVVATRPSEVRLVASQQGNRLELAFHYDKAVIGGDVISALSHQLQACLADISQRPTAPISSFSLTNESVLPKGAQTGAVTQNTILEDAYIHYRIERQVEKTPDALALVCEDQQLTYHELNARANQLAHYLQSLGAGPDVPVAMYLERSPQLLITLLAILKAGSAYLPMDLALPISGVNYRLQDAQAPILVTRQYLLGDTTITAAQVVCLDCDREKIAQQNDTNPDSAIVPENLAYIIYTSGSTGQPKGVAVEHRQLVTYVDRIMARLDLPANAHYASVSTVAADLGNTMIFPCLCQGGTLHLIAAERIGDAQALGDYIEQHPIDCLKIVPSHLKALLQTPNAKPLLPRQRLVLGGETCTWSLAEQIQHLAPDCQSFNHYGPTETTVGVLTHAINPSAQQTASTVPIGQGLDNSHIYLLDTDLIPVPIGIPGEIYIGGASVTRGYLKRPGLTADRFIPDPFSAQPGARMYRTGDVARYQPDGNLEFLRRADLQVKLHGFRIELGEIETRLLQHPDVQAVSVVVREHEPENGLLVAYVVPQADTTPDSSDLRLFLRQRLPNYMIPSLFVTLSALPLTPNGKVNRQALPAPERIRPDLGRKYVAPRNPTEETIAGIWTEVLGLETVGVNDNFFELGGHSLLATQVLSRLRESFQVELPLRQLFDAHTVAEIATVVEDVLLAEIEAMTDEEAQEFMQQQ